MIRRITKHFSAANLVGAIALVTGAARAQASQTAAPQPIAYSEPSGGASTPQSCEGPDEPQVLLSGKVAHGGFGAPEVKVTRLADTTGLLVGGQGAWVVAHSIMLGGGGYGLATSVDAPSQSRSAFGDSSLQFGYGGFRAGYVLFPRSLVHATAGFLIGGGGVSLVERYPDPTHAGQTDSRVYRSASVFVFEPELALEVNINKFMRAAADVSYRYVADSGIAGLSSSKLSWLAGGAMLKFGWF
jgi:hypothetical protein